MSGWWPCPCVMAYSTYPAVAVVSWRAASRPALQPGVVFDGVASEKQEAPVTDHKVEAHADARKVGHVGTGEHDVVVQHEAAVGVQFNTQVAGLVVETFDGDVERGDERFFENVAILAIKKAPLGVKPCGSGPTPMMPTRAKNAERGRGEFSGKRRAGVNAGKLSFGCGVEKHFALKAGEPPVVSIPDETGVGPRDDEGDELVFFADTHGSSDVELGGGQESLPRPTAMPLT